MTRQKPAPASPPLRLSDAAAAVPDRRRPGLTLYRYVAREALRPTLFALLGLTAVVLTEDLLGFSDLVINRGLGAGTVAWIAFYQAVPVAATMLPFAVLVGSLVALGRLGADREILVLEASGIAAWRLVWPLVCFAGAMTLAALALALAVAPWANRSLDASLEEIARRQPWAHFRAGVVSEFGGWQVEAREVSAGGDRLRGVLLWMPDIGETIFARAGHVRPTPEGVIEITLTEGALLLSPRGGARQIRFDAMTTTLPQSEEPLPRDERDRLGGLTLNELSERSAGFRPTYREAIPLAALALQRRFAVPAAALIFGFLAVPLFLTRRTFSRSGGIVMGALCTIAYYGLVQLGEGLMQAQKLGVVLGAWLPNLVVGALAAVLLLRVRREGVLGHKFDRPRARETRPLPPDAARRRRGPKRFALPRYVAERFVRLAALSFSVLLVAYLLVDVMERLEWFMRYHATGSEIVRFYAARVPLLASRVVPMALLVATSLTVSLLAVEGELLGMRACGIPAPRALLPVLAISALVAPASFLLNNVVVPRTNALADRLKQTEIKAEFYAAIAEHRKAAVWYRSGQQVLEADVFDTDRGEAREITIYEIGENGLPISRDDAREARHIGRGVWRLSESARLEISDGHVRQVDARRFAELGQTLPAEVDTMHLGVAQLAREIREVEANGYDATALRVDYHVKLAEGLACLVLPAVVLFFAVGGPPFPGPAQTLLVSGILGVGYILLTGIAASLGYGGAVPTAVGGWGPTLVLASLAGWFGLRLWRRM